MTRGARSRAQPSLAWSAGDDAEDGHRAWRGDNNGGAVTGLLGVLAPPSIRRETGRHTHQSADSDTIATSAVASPAISASVSTRQVPFISTSLGRNRALYAIFRLSGTQ
jgi:hypothetical protein